MLEKITLNISEKQMCMLQKLVNQSIDEDCNRVWEREILCSLKKELEDAYKKPVMTKEDLQERLKKEREYWEKRNANIALVHNMVRAEEDELRFKYEILEDDGEDKTLYIDDPEEMAPYVSSSQYDHW